VKAVRPAHQAPQISSLPDPTGTVQLQVPEESKKSKGKVVPVLNLALSHENVMGERRYTPFIPNLGTRWKRVVSFTPRQLYPRYPMQRKLGRQ